VPVRPRSTKTATCRLWGYLADYNDVIYAATREEIQARRDVFHRKWRLKHRAVADSLQEADGWLFTFTRLPPESMEERTHHEPRRLHEEFKRRIKTQTCCRQRTPRPYCSGLYSLPARSIMSKVNG
jgi:transposase-like protein